MPAARRLFAFTAVVTALALPAPAVAEDPPFVGWTAALPALGSSYEPSSSDECLAGRTSCVDKVIRTMTRRFDRLADACDHDAPFALAYLRTTEEYRRTVADPAFFIDTPFVNHEDAVFADYYFRAFDAYHGGDATQVPPAWKVAFDAARDRTVSGLGDILLGMNAHIQRDLPFVLAQIGLVAPDGTSRKADHDKVNVFLNRVQDAIITEAARRFDPTIDDGAIPGTIADEFASFQLVQGWREEAWRAAERLVGAGSPAERAAVAQGIEANTAAQATAIRSAFTHAPLSGGAVTRDAYCAAHHDD